MSSARVESQTQSLSSDKAAGVAGRDPVARIPCSNVNSRAVPSPATTRTDRGPRSSARPWRYVTPRWVLSCPKPPVKRPTTPSFQARRRSRSIDGSPKRIPHASASLASVNTLATCNSAFDGMHPRYKQTPPGLAASSINVTFSPRSAARNAAAYPPGPPPITASCVASVISAPLYGPQESGFQPSPSAPGRATSCLPKTPLTHETLRAAEIRHLPTPFRHSVTSPFSCLPCASRFMMMYRRRTGCIVASPSTGARGRPSDARAKTNRPRRRRLSSDRDHSAHAHRRSAGSRTLPGYHPGSNDDATVRAGRHRRRSLDA